MFEDPTPAEQEQMVKDIIVDVVTRVQGCKISELLCHDSIARGLPGGHPLPGSIPDLIEDLIKEGRLVEVEYVLPSLSFRAKSFLLPPETKITKTKPASEHLTVQDRINAIYDQDISLEDVISFEYSWSDPDGTGAAYEKLDIKRKNKGGYSFSGVYHPNVVCEGGGVCKHCGVTLLFD